MKRPAMPKTVGVRLSVEDRAKLDQVCAATRRPPGEVLRLLIRQVQIPDLPTFTFTKSDQAPNDKRP